MIKVNSRLTILFLLIGILIPVNPANSAEIKCPVNSIAVSKPVSTEWLKSSTTFSSLTIIGNFEVNGCIPNNPKGRANIKYSGQLNVNFRVSISTLSTEVVKGKPSQKTGTVDCVVAPGTTDVSISKKVISAAKKNSFPIMKCSFSTYSQTILIQQKSPSMTIKDLIGIDTSNKSQISFTPFIRILVAPTGEISILNEGYELRFFVGSSCEHLFIKNRCFPN
jgi:hypothetical protein